MVSVSPIKHIFRTYRGSHFASRWVCQILDRLNIKKVIGYQLTFVTLIVSFAQPLSNTMGFPPSVAAVEPEPFIEAALIKTEPTLAWPVYNAHLTQGYHWGHPGIDIQGDAAIHPIDKGTVSGVLYEKWGYGTHVIVQHPNGRSSLYGHLSKISVKQGQEVTRETVLGIMGSTGFSTGTHLHLEIYENGATINPLSILPTE